MIKIINLKNNKKNLIISCNMSKNMLMNTFNKYVIINSNN